MNVMNIYKNINNIITLNHKALYLPMWITREMTITAITSSLILLKTENHSIY